MYYVAKVYKTMLPTIVESFENRNHAEMMCMIMNKSGKGPHVVLGTEMSVEQAREAIKAAHNQTTGRL